MPEMNIRLGIIAMVLSTFTLSLHNILIKLLLTSYSTAEVLLYRNIFAVAVLILILVFIDPKSMAFWNHPKSVYFRSFLSLVSWVLGIIAIKLLPLSLAVTIYATCPIFAAGMAMVLKDEPRRLSRIMAVFVGFLGFALIAFENLEGSVSGMAAALGSSFSQAVGIILVRRSDEYSSTNVFTFNTLTMLIIFSGAYVTTADMAPVPVGNPLIIFVLMGICYLGTMWFGTVSYRLAPITYVTGLQNLPIIWLAIFDFVYAGIYPKPELFLGACFIILSGVYLVSPAGKLIGLESAWRSAKARIAGRSLH